LAAPLLKAMVLVDSERPKVSESEVVSLLKKSRIEHSVLNPTFGIVVGGDGLFSYQGRQLGIPLLFVGTKSRRPTDSKARLAEVYLTGLEAALREVRSGRFTVTAHKRLAVWINGGEFKGEIFTDVSLEKGADSNCIRYTLNVKGRESEFTDAAVSNGVVITTASGSTGYYSYLDKLDRGERLQPEKFSVIGEDEVGVCHIAPTYTSRDSSAVHPLRYSVPWGSTFKITLMRDADAHLFGVTKSRKGLRITTKDVVEVRPSKNTTNVIRISSRHLS
jgi:translation initiation factor IF-1